MMAKTLANSMHALRIFSLAASIVAIALLATNNITYHGLKRSFNDVITYRFVFAVAVITASYTLMQLPFSIYYAVNERRMVRDGYLPEFDFYGDKVISLLLASGIGAGFAYSSELKKLYNDHLGVQIDSDIRFINETFFDRGTIVAGVLMLGLVCMTVCSVLSS